VLFFFLWFGQHSDYIIIMAIKLDVDVASAMKMHLHRIRLFTVMAMISLALICWSTKYESPVVVVRIDDDFPRWWWWWWYRDDQRDDRHMINLPENMGDAYLLQIQNCNQKKMNLALLETDIMDTDQDGTPDCHDGCPHDPTKTSPGVCGCGISDDTDDMDGDTIPDCVDECIDNDPEIQSYCDLIHHRFGDECKGCAKKYIMIWNECNEVCLNDVDYCIRWSKAVLFEYDGNVKRYVLKSLTVTITCLTATDFESGGDGKLDFKLECDDLDTCKQSTYWNGIRCNDIGSDDDIDNYDDLNKECLHCDNGEVYCHDGFPPSSSSPFFYQAFGIHNIRYYPTDETGRVVNWPIFKMMDLDLNISELKWITSSDFGGHCFVNRTAES